MSMPTRYLTLGEILELYQQVIRTGGGTAGIRDLGALQSALAQPRMTFEGKELYPTIVEKAGALGHALATNHPFVDGNKRIAHAAMEVLILLNGYEIQATVEEQESVMLRLASGDVDRKSFIEWLREHLVEKKTKK